MIGVRFRPETLDAGLREHLADRFETVAFIVEDEAEKASLRVKAEGFSPDGTGDTLRIRSGAGFAAQGSTFERKGDFAVTADYGAVNADPHTLMYLQQQEGGGVLTPAFADKLAFPPSDAGYPVRDDVTGVQLMGATEFAQEHDALGYPFVLWTDHAVLARPAWGRELEVMFIRADAVETPPAQIVHKQFEPFITNIKRRIEEDA